MPRVRMSWDSADSELWMIRHPITREIIRERDRKHERKPDKAERHPELCELGRELHVHEEEYHERRLNARDDQRHHNIEIVEVNECGADRDRRANHQRGQDRIVGLFRYNMLRHTAYKWRSTR